MKKVYKGRYKHKFLNKTYGNKCFDFYDFIAVASNEDELRILFNNNPELFETIELSFSDLVEVDLMDSQILMVDGES